MSVSQPSTPGHQIPKGYKQTEVGVIPEEWEVKPLNVISPRQSVGLVINPSTYFDRRGTVPLLVGSNVSENCIDAASANRITNASNEMLSASRLAAGDLVMVRVGEPGVTAVVPPELDGCNCASMMIVRKHLTFDSNWLCCAMNSHQGRQQVEHVQYGTAQKQFNISDAVDFRYPVPGLPEQRAIAAALSDVDALLGALDRLIAKKRDLKQAATQQLLTGQTRLPGFASAKSQFKQTEIGLLPDDWEVERIRRVATIETGSRNTQDRIEDGAYPFFVRSSTVERINSYSFDGEAVLTAGDGVGTGKVFHYINGKFDIHQRVYKISDFSPRLIGRFFFLVFSTRFYDRIMSMTAKSSVDSVRMEMIADMLIPLPLASEQTAIAEVLSDMDAEITAFEQRREKTSALKQAMMQELLTGRTRLVPVSVTEGHTEAKVQMP